jgi:hypothetical protein
MQFKTVKPAHRTFSSFGNPPKNSVPGNTLIMTDGYFCAVYETYTCTFAETHRIQKEHQRHKNPVFYLNKATV